MNTRPSSTRIVLINRDPNIRPMVLAAAPDPKSNTVIADPEATRILHQPKIELDTRSELTAVLADPDRKRNFLAGLGVEKIPGRIETAPIYPIVNDQRLLLEAIKDAAFKTTFIALLNRQSFGKTLAFLVASYPKTLKQIAEDADIKAAFQAHGFFREDQVVTTETKPDGSATTI